jgi:hypothetical protein
MKLIIKKQILKKYISYYDIGIQDLECSAARIFISVFTDENIISYYEIIWTN